MGVLIARGGSSFRAGAVVNARLDGRSMASSGLTEMQRRFAAAYVANGGRGTDAAREAGYATPPVDSWKLLRNEAVVDAVRREFAVRVRAEAATVGLSVLLDVAQDAGQSGAARVSAAKALLQLAGHGGAGGAQLEDDDEGESLGTMSYERLVSVVTVLESRRDAHPALT